MDKVKEQLYEALRDIRENNAGSNERARGWCFSVSRDVDVAKA